MNGRVPRSKVKIEIGKCVWKPENIFSSIRLQEMIISSPKKHEKKGFLAQREQSIIIFVVRDCVLISAFNSLLKNRQIFGEKTPSGWPAFRS